MRGLACLVALPLLFDAAVAFMLSQPGDTKYAPLPRTAGIAAYAVFVDWDDVSRLAIARRIVHLAAHRGATGIEAMGAPQNPAVTADTAVLDWQSARLAARAGVRDDVAARSNDLSGTPGGITLLLR
jgi:hypothetical protein